MQEKYNKIQFRVEGHNLSIRSTVFIWSNNDHINTVIKLTYYKSKLLLIPLFGSYFDRMISYAEMFKNLKKKRINHIKYSFPAGLRILTLGSVFTISVI